MSETIFDDRDLSWLSFNERLLDEAEKPIPLLERIKFLSIFSSNLDEFYRVRMPALLALQKINKKGIDLNIYRRAASRINGQQIRYGNIFDQQIIPALKEKGYVLHKGPVPEEFRAAATHYFFTQIAGFLQPLMLGDHADFFPENNQLYMAVIVRDQAGTELMYLVNVPYGALPRFLRLSKDGGQYIFFLEDLIRGQLSYLFPDEEIIGSYNIKITRDAELSLEDEYGEDLAEKIEKQLVKRDLGFASRLLYEPGMPLRHLQFIVDLFSLQKASVVEGGHYHNLRDLASLPVHDPALEYPDWPAIQSFNGEQGSLFAAVSLNDHIVHAPYHSYDAILRFFNEAAVDTSVEEISTTLYRVAADSRIARALITAAHNGKKVLVVVELKARFDEANNIRWAKKMKAAGVRIIYSSNALKVHAKVALIRRRHPTLPYLGLLATGNMNETTARFYTDHILLTSRQEMIRELEWLFAFLAKRKKPEAGDEIDFNYLLVAQFNLQERFLALIDREIDHAVQGVEAWITIKLNNLEEEQMITKLYQASNAGVKINLIVRGICRLVAGITGLSENITVRRIVDRYLEHGRVFHFANNGEDELWLGSADWMNRNIFNRIEVCFPVLDQRIRLQLKEMLSLQLRDNVQAVWVRPDVMNEPVKNDEPPLRSQEAIWQYLSLNPSIGHGINLQA